MVDEEAKAEPAPRYVSMATAAAETGISANTVRRWVRQGEVRAYTAGRRVVVQLSDVQAQLRPYEPRVSRKEIADATA